MNKTRYQLTFEAKTDTVAPATRLKRLLKTALRRDRLRCVEIRELKDQETTLSTGRAGVRLSRMTGRSTPLSTTCRMWRRGDRRPGATVETTP